MLWHKIQRIQFTIESSQNPLGFPNFRKFWDFPQVHTRRRSHLLTWKSVSHGLLSLAFAAVRAKLGLMYSGTRIKSRLCLFVCCLFVRSSAPGFASERVDRNSTKLTGRPSFESTKMSSSWDWCDPSYLKKWKKLKSANSGHVEVFLEDLDAQFVVTALRLNVGRTASGMSYLKSVIISIYVVPGIRKWWEIFPRIMCRIKKVESGTQPKSGSRKLKRRLWRICRMLRGVLPTSSMWWWQKLIILRVGNQTNY